MKTIIANTNANVVAVIKMREDERQASGMSIQDIASAYMRENHPEITEWTISDICAYDMDINIYKFSCDIQRRGRLTLLKSTGMVCVILLSLCASRTTITRTTN